MRTVTAILVLTGVLAALSPGASAQDQTTVLHLTGDRWSVDVLNAVPIGPVSSPIGVRVKFSYAFAERQNVWLDDVGIVKASGELEYVSRAQTLKFRSARGG